MPFYLNWINKEYYIGSWRSSTIGAFCRGTVTLRMPSSATSGSEPWMSSPPQWSPVKHSGATVLIESKPARLVYLQCLLQLFHIFWDDLDNVRHLHGLLQLCLQEIQQTAARVASQSMQHSHHQIVTQSNETATEGWQVSLIFMLSQCIVFTTWRLAKQKQSKPSRNRTNWEERDALDGSQIHAEANLGITL